MSSCDKINKLFWLNYAQAIKAKADVNLGASSALLLPNKVQNGPVAGDGIPDEDTNQGLYDISNNLLAADDLFYNPSPQHGYIQALRK
ncbi:hypothetical protein PG997_011866 [Apiospora hydei]|uniref:Uncharacterized protein n=1 Tax=Apiospora hydei TaxID=1337664 RepID=A0ABR1V4Y5_9PEZI